MLVKVSSNPASFFFIECLNNSFHFSVIIKRQKSIFGYVFSDNRVISAFSRNEPEVEYFTRGIYKLDIDVNQQILHLYDLWPTFSSEKTSSDLMVSFKVRFSSKYAKYNPTKITIRVTDQAIFYICCR